MRAQINYNQNMTVSPLIFWVACCVKVKVTEGSKLTLIHDQSLVSVLYH